MAFTSQTPNVLHKPDTNSLRSLIQKMKQQHLSVPEAEEETFCYVAPENLQSLKTNWHDRAEQREGTFKLWDFSEGLGLQFRDMTEWQPPTPAGEQRNCWMVGKRVFALEVWKQK